MLSGWKLRLSKFFVIPQRYVMGIMGFFAIVNAYTMRVSLSVAITEMVPMQITDNQYNSSCNFENPNHTKLTVVTEAMYNWSGSQQGVIQSSFYWGYVLTQVPGGILAERFGGKHVLGLGMLLTSLITMLTPLVLFAFDGSWIWFVILRVIIGLAEGPTYPALTAILSKWVPLEERSKIGTLVYAGSQIGTMVGTLLSGFLIESTQTWSAVFYFFGGIGVLWTLLWTLLCFSGPDTHPYISDNERNFLRKQMEYVTSEKRNIPWKGMLASVPVWALIFAQVGHDWGFFAMVTDLPKFMKEILRFNVKENGIWSSLPYIFMWVTSMLSGWFCDWLIKRNWIGISAARKLFTTIASMGPAIFIVAAAYTGCDKMLAIWFFTIAMALMGTFYCGMKVNALDLSPNFAGALMSVVNGIGALTGIIVPYLIGALTDNHTVEEWRTVFWITFGIFSVTNLVYLLFASGEIQRFDTEKAKEAPETPPTSSIQSTEESFEVMKM